MRYSVLLDRKTMIISVVGMVLVVALLFVAGFLLATYWLSSKETRGPGRATPWFGASQPTATQGDATAATAARTGTRESVLTRAPAAGTGSAPASGGAPEGYWIQVGAFASNDNLGDFLESLRARGYVPYLAQTIDAEGRVLQAVRLGGYPTLVDAARAASRLESEQGLRPLVGGPSPP